MRWLFAALLVLVGAGADAQELRLVVHATTGGTMLHARLVAQLLPRVWPGARVIVQGMPGAGGLVAAQYLATQAPRDGSTIATLAQRIPGLEGRSDPAAFNWLGSAIDGRLVPFVLFKRTDAAELIAGVDAELGVSLAGEVRQILGWPIRDVAGYADVQQTRLALERGETTVATSNLSGIKLLAPHWLDSTLIRPVLQWGNGRQRHAELADVPTLAELAPADQAGAVEALELRFAIARGYGLPPGVPGPIVARWRAAFASLFADPAYRAAMQAMGGSTPLDGVQVQAIVARLRGSKS